MEYASPAIARIDGVEPDAVLGDVKLWAANIIPEDRDVALEHLERARQGEAAVHESCIQRPSDKAFRWIRSIDFPLLDERGRVQRVGGIAEDVTEAKRLLKPLLKKQGCPPRRLVTDKLGSYAAARRQILPSVEHRSHKDLNNRAENSHLPLRRRERIMQSFRSPGGLQWFTTIFSAVHNVFVPPRTHHSALVTHLHRLNAVAGWRTTAGIIV